MTVRARHRRAAAWRGLLPALVTVGAVVAVVTVGGGDAPRTAAVPGQAQAQVPAAAAVEVLRRAAPLTRTASLEPARTASPAVSPVAPRPVAGAQVLERSRPLRLRVPSLQLDTSLVDLDLAADGTLEVPPGATPAGWYVGSPSPGQLGPAVLAGHVDYAGQAGVFARLHQLGLGAEVTVTRTDGRDAVFRVTRVDRVDKDAFPTDEVYGDLDHAGLRLITCGGRFSRAARSYDDNVIAYAELVRTV